VFAVTRLGILFIAAALAIGCAASLSDGLLSDENRALCAEAVRAAAEEHGEGIEISVWIGGPEGDAWFALNENVFRPAASSVKTAYLVELFAAHAGHLDEPLPGMSEILSDPTHPAIVHFDGETQEEIRRDHAGATVRRVGEMMIRGTDVSNAVYNAAANVTTATLGGPEGITERVHGRAPDLRGVAIRRHMLADRNATGDNEVTAEFLARVFQRIMRGDFPGCDDETLDAIRDVMHVDPHPDYGDHFFKSGSLNTDPLARIRSGAVGEDGRVIVYAVMTTQPDPAGRERQEAGDRLHETTVQLTERLIALAHGTAAH
jgi:hypothetical protein